MRRVLLLAGTLSIIACRDENPPISQQRMLPLVIELHLADAFSGQISDSLHPNKEKNLDSLAVWTLRILEKNEVSQEAFNDAMDWYRDHPDRLQELYTAAADSIERMKK